MKQEETIMASEELKQADHRVRVGGVPRGKRLASNFVALQT
jgi:hypothetical protein